MRQKGGIVLLHDLERSEEREQFVFATTDALLDLAKRESLTICVHPVQDWRLLWRTEENPFVAFREPASRAYRGANPLRNRLPARIFTVDILARESTIPAVRFPNPV